MLPHNRFSQGQVKFLSKFMNQKFFIGHTNDEENNAVGSGNDFEFNCDSVSKTHAVISSDPKAGFVLKDLESKTGTYVNGVKLRPLTMVVLFPGAQVHLGDPREGQSFVVFFLKNKPERRSSSIKRPHQSSALVSTLITVGAKKNPV